MHCQASRSIACLALALSIGSSAIAQDSTEPSVPDKDLSNQQLQNGLVADQLISLPSPPELLFILSKQGSPKWRQLYHPAIQGQESDRTKTALRLGFSIAEAHLATMARDAQKIRDITNDLQRYAKVLGISSGLADNARNINSLAEAKSWPIIAFELESLVTQTSDILRAQRDPELADLINTGQWVRLLQVSSSIVTEADFPDTSIAISHHTTLEQLVASHKDSTSTTVCSARDQLAKISRLWSPEKIETGHKFDDALIKETRERLTNIVDLFTN